MQLSLILVLLTKGLFKYVDCAPLVICERHIFVVGKVSLSLFDIFEFDGHIFV